LTKAIARFPKRASLYSSRATLWGRQKNIEAARNDVEAALQLDRSPIVCYQAASALLLASDTNDDRARAIALLKETLRKEPGLKSTMDTDHDLDPIRNDEQFKALLNAAILLQ
jgi:predicted Zn-dependent protease